MSINQFKSGDKIQEYFVIKNVQCKKSNANNSKYLDLILVDKTGEINAKLWRCSNEDEEIYKENKLVKVKGAIIDWQGNIQLRIDKIREVEEKDNISISEFVPSAPISSENMYTKIKDTISKMDNKDIKEIVTYLLEEQEEKLMFYPAAKKNHHSIRGGLLYHTTTMLTLGEKVCEVYDFLNKDLLFAGIILHDIAKIEEMDSSKLGIVSDYTVEGQLLGHIVQGVKKIEVASQMIGADKEVTMLLEHMILSHHYEAEYGSPKKPMIPEAQVLHYLDILDASMFDMKKALFSTEKGKFSESIWSLEKRKIYKVSKEI